MYGNIPEPKAIQLAFHDCKLCTDGSGGCDGYLNLEENIEDNNMLQPTVAILVYVVNNSIQFINYIIGKALS